MSALTDLQRIVAPWWRRWPTRMARGRALLATLPPAVFDELVQAAAQHYWSPGRRVDRLSWRVAAHFPRSGRSAKSKEACDAEVAVWGRRRRARVRTRK